MGFGSAKFWLPLQKHELYGEALPDIGQSISWKPCVNQATLVMVTQVDRTMVYSSGLEGLQLGGVTGLSGYTRTSKVHNMSLVLVSLYIGNETVT